MADFDPDAYLSSAPAAPPAASGAFDPDAYLAGSQGASAPVTALGLAKSYGVGVPLGGLSVADTAMRGMALANPLTAGMVMADAASRAGDKIADLIGAPPSTSSSLASRLNPASYYDTANDWLSNKIQELHQPQNPAERAAQTLGEFTSGIVGGGEADAPLALRALTRVAVPAAASELAGYETQGKWYEPYARAAAALVSGVGAEAGATQAHAALTRTPLPPPAPGPMGIRYSEGQSTGDLTTIRREQAALKDQLGPGAAANAKAFAAQQAGEVDEATQRVAQGLGPFGQTVAMTPQEAADIVSRAMTHAEGSRAADIAQDETALSAGIDQLPHPYDAADTVANALRENHQAGVTAGARRAGELVAQREQLRQGLNPDGNVLARSPQEAADIISGAVGNQAERAREATDAAYDQLRNLPGRFHPAAFNGVGDAIRSNLNAGTEPIRVNAQTTPIANSALGDLDEILAPIHQSRDEQGRVQPAPNEVTPALVDDTRKRLNTFLGDAISSARASNNWSDVRAMRGVMAAFDEYVATKLARGAYLGGDAADVGAAMTTARGMHAQYRRNFTPQGPGDTVGSAIQQIVGRYDGQAAPPNQIAQWLYGAGAMPVKIAQRLLGIFGDDGPEATALRQGYLSHIIERPEGVTEFGPAQIADRIGNAINGPGRALTQAYFSPQVRAQLASYAEALRSSAEPPASSTDVVSRAINRIVGAGGQPATSAEVSDTLFGRNAIGTNPVGVKLAQHVRDTQGPQSDAFMAIRQGVMSRLLNAGASGAGLDAQGAAARIRDFLDRGRPMADTLFTPQEQATLAHYAERLEQHAAQAGAPADEVGRMVARITGRDGGQPANPVEVADMLYGRTGTADKGSSVRLVQRLRGQFGDDSPTWGAIKQGMFSRLIEPAAGRQDWGSQKIAERLNEFLNGSGHAMAQAMFNADERALLQEYADMHRKLVVPRGGANYSETSTFMASILRRIGSTVGMLVGGGLGGAIGHGMGIPFVGEAVGAGLARGVGAMGDRAAARQVRRQMPLIGDSLVRYAKARQAIPQNAASLAIATRALTTNLKPLGIDFSALNTVQGTTAAGAQQQQQPQQHQRGGRVHHKPDRGEQAKARRFADGGDVAARNAPYVRPIPSTYRTDLGAMEPIFRAWVAANKVPFNPDAPASDYDMRGFWQAMVNGDPRAQSAVDPNDSRLHFPDYWKTPLHQTFSNQSQWATQDAPQWNASDQLVAPSARILFDDRDQDQGGTPKFARGGRVAPRNIDHAPTEAQKKAGNYAKDHVHIHGLDITIENAKGALRSGVGRDGKPWSVRMPAHYGYIKGTIGRDRDHVDVYVGPHPKSPHVFVVDQMDAESGRFDEHKAFLGFSTAKQARRAYIAGFSDGKGHRRLGHMEEMPVAVFKRWLETGDTTKRAEGVADDHKLSHKAVGYVAQSCLKGKHCSVCSMFRKGPQCTLVAEPINPGGWCRRFDPKGRQ